MPLSVSTVWIRQGTASIRAAKKADAVTRVALSTSCTKASLLVRSMATKRWSLPSAVRTSAMCKRHADHLLPFST